MLETGDFVQIRFQDEPRNKKPIGIYWLQAASAALCGSAQYRKIWPYRIPSLFGAIFSVLLMFAMGKRLFGERAGMLGAALGACSFLLVMEAHLATTDAVLLATIMAAQAALSRFYLRADENEPGTVGFSDILDGTGRRDSCKRSGYPYDQSADHGLPDSSRQGRRMDERNEAASRPGDSGRACKPLGDCHWPCHRGAFFRQALVGDFAFQSGVGPGIAWVSAGLLPPSDASYPLAGIGVGGSIYFSGMEITVHSGRTVLPCLDNTCMDSV